MLEKHKISNIMVNHKVLLTVLGLFCHIHVNYGHYSKSEHELTKNDVLDDAVASPCQGQPGRDGRDGRDSIVPGPPGPPGPRGGVGKMGLPGRSVGVVYTRWGRKTCPKGTTLLYEGVMGGSHHTHPGGGSNQLCMPLNPIYSKTINGNQGYSYLFGIEYEMNTHAPLFPTNLHDHEAVCSVCQAESRSSYVMIPARNVCPSGWTLEYHGYLMSENYDHKRSQFICVDSAPEARAGTGANLNGGLLYVVESHCGALPCPPYTQGAELTCAVCTK